VGHILNGWADRYLYRAGLLDPSLPFDRLRQRARITDVSKAAENNAEYSKRIRAGMSTGNP
jgi:hypothetical protein